jgi:hypothetical protein
VAVHFFRRGQAHNSLRFAPMPDIAVRVAIGLQFMVCACLDRVRVLGLQRRSVAQLG